MKATETMPRPNGLLDSSNRDTASRRERTPNFLSEDDVCLFAVLSAINSVRVTDAQSSAQSRS